MTMSSSSTTSSSPPSYTRAQWSSLSIQERIRAMNDSLEGVDLSSPTNNSVSASTTTFKEPIALPTTATTTTKPARGGAGIGGAGARPSSAFGNKNSSIESSSSFQGKRSPLNKQVIVGGDDYNHDEQHQQEQQGETDVDLFPKRSSVVDIWRRREGAAASSKTSNPKTSASAHHAVAPSPSAVAAGGVASSAALSTSEVVLSRGGTKSFGASKQRNRPSRLATNDGADLFLNELKKRGQQQQQQPVHVGTASISPPSVVSPDAKRKQRWGPPEGEHPKRPPTTIVDPGKVYAVERDDATENDEEKKEDEESLASSEPQGHQRQDAGYNKFSVLDRWPRRSVQQQQQHAFSATVHSQQTVKSKAATAKLQPTSPRLGIQKQRIVEPPTYASYKNYEPTDMIVISDAVISSPTTDTSTTTSATDSDRQEKEEKAVTVTRRNHVDRTVSYNHQPWKWNDADTTHEVSSSFSSLPRPVNVPAVSTPSISVDAETHVSPRTSVVDRWRQRGSNKSYSPTPSSSTLGGNQQEISAPSISSPQHFRFESSTSSIPGPDRWQHRRQQQQGSSTEQPIQKGEPHSERQEPKINQRGNVADRWVNRNGLRSEHVVESPRPKYSAADSSRFSDRRSGLPPPSPRESFVPVSQPETVTPRLNRWMGQPRTEDRRRDSSPSSLGSIDSDSVSAINKDVDDTTMGITYSESNINSGHSSPVVDKPATSPRKIADLWNQRISQAEERDTHLDRTGKAEVQKTRITDRWMQATTMSSREEDGDEMKSRASFGFLDDGDPVVITDRSDEGSARTRTKQSDVSADQMRTSRNRNAIGQQGSHASAATREEADNAGGARKSGRATDTSAHRKCTESLKVWIDRDEDRGVMDGFDGTGEVEGGRSSEKPGTKQQDAPDFLPTRTVVNRWSRKTHHDQGRSTPVETPMLLEVRAGASDEVSVMSSSPKHFKADEQGKVFVFDGEDDPADGTGAAGKKGVYDIDTTLDSTSSPSIPTTTRRWNLNSDSGRGQDPRSETHDATRSPAADSWSRRTKDDVSEAPHMGERKCASGDSPGSPKNGGSLSTYSSTQHNWSLISKPEEKEGDPIRADIFECQPESPKRSTATPFEDNRDSRDSRGVSNESPFAINVRSMPESVERPCSAGGLFGQERTDRCLPELPDDGRQGSTRDAREEAAKPALHAVDSEDREMGEADSRQEKADAPADEEVSTSVDVAGGPKQIITGNPQSSFKALAPKTSNIGVFRNKWSTEKETDNVIKSQVDGEQSNEETPKMKPLTSCTADDSGIEMESSEAAKNVPSIDKGGSNDAKTPNICADEGRRRIASYPVLSVPRSPLKAAEPPSTITQSGRQGSMKSATKPRKSQELKIDTLEHNKPEACKRSAPPTSTVLPFLSKLSELPSPRRKEGESGVEKDSQPLVKPIDARRSRAIEIGKRRRQGALSANQSLSPRLVRLSDLRYQQTQTQIKGNDDSQEKSPNVRVAQSTSPKPRNVSRNFSDTWCKRAKALSSIKTHGVAVAGGSTRPRNEERPGISSQPSGKIKAASGRAPINLLSAVSSPKMSTTRHASLLADLPFDEAALASSNKESTAFSFCRAPPKTLQMDRAGQRRGEISDSHERQHPVDEESRESRATGNDLSATSPVAPRSPAYRLPIVNRTLTAKPNVESPRIASSNYSSPLAAKSLFGSSVASGSLATPRTRTEDCFRSGVSRPNQDDSSEREAVLNLEEECRREVVIPPEGFGSYDIFARPNTSELSQVKTRHCFGALHAQEAVSVSIPTVKKQAPEMQQPNSGEIRNSTGMQYQQDHVSFGSFGSRNATCGVWNLGNRGPAEMIDSTASVTSEPLMQKPHLRRLETASTAGSLLGLETRRSRKRDFVSLGRQHATKGLTHKLVQSFDVRKDQSLIDGSETSSAVGSSAINSTSVGLGQTALMSLVGQDTERRLSAFSSVSSGHNGPAADNTRVAPADNTRGSLIHKTRARSEAFENDFGMPHGVSPGETREAEAAARSPALARSEGKSGLSEDGGAQRTNGSDIEDFILDISIDSSDSFSQQMARSLENDRNNATTAARAGILPSSPHEKVGRDQAEELLPIHEHEVNPGLEGITPSLEGPVPQEGEQDGAASEYTPLRVSDSAASRSRQDSTSRQDSMSTQSPEQRQLQRQKSPASDGGHSDGGLSPFSEAAQSGFSGVSGASNSSVSLASRDKPTAEERIGSLRDDAAEDGEVLDQSFEEEPEMATEMEHHRVGIPLTPHEMSESFLDSSELAMDLSSKRALHERKTHERRRLGLSNRYNTSSRFIDSKMSASPSGPATLSDGVSVEASGSADTAMSSFQTADTASTTSDSRFPGSRASSTRGSSAGLSHREERRSRRRQSRAGGLVSDQFVNENMTNMKAFRSAVRAMSFGQIASDWVGEVSLATFDVKKVANDMNETVKKFVGSGGDSPHAKSKKSYRGVGTACDKQYKQSYHPYEQEDVAIEVEYMDDEHTRSSNFGVGSSDDGTEQPCSTAAESSLGDLSVPRRSSSRRVDV